MSTKPKEAIKSTTCEPKMHCLNLKKWPILSSLPPDFIAQIHKVMVYGVESPEALFIMKTKKVYAMGTNKNGCLGLGCYGRKLHPEEVTQLSEKNVKTFACGINHVLALTEDGEVYSWGSNDNGELGTNGIESSVPGLVKITRGTIRRRIVDIACGVHYSLALTEEGEVYTWGDAGYKRDICSNGELRYPTRIKYDLNKKKVVQIACGKNFSMALTEDGEVYSWGINCSGQLGVKDYAITYSVIKSPNQITLLPKIVKIACGLLHALALSEEGELYAWGKNIDGQLGIGTHEDSSTPCKITHKMERVIDIVTLNLGSISVAVCEDMCVYMWGDCHGQEILLPMRMPLLSVYDIFAFYAYPSIMHQPLQIESVHSNMCNVYECLQNVFNDELTSDLTIRVENQLIYVHKSILQIRSTYFKKMFQSNWSENNQKAPIKRMLKRWSNSMKVNKIGIFVTDINDINTWAEKSRA